MADGDTVTVYVSTADPRELSCVPREVQAAAVKRSKARDRKDYANADAIHKQIVDSGYRLKIICSTLFSILFSTALVLD